MPSDARNARPWPIGGYDINIRVCTTTEVIKIYNDSQSQCSQFANKKAIHYNMIRESLLDGGGMPTLTMGRIVIIAYLPARYVNDIIVRLQ